MSFTATYYFYAELNDFLTKKNRSKAIVHSFNNFPVVKDSIEALGVPHPEIAFINVNDKFVGFDYKVQNNDSIKIYPYFYYTDLLPIMPISPDNTPRFILDVHLGGLARYLRMAGFDTLYNSKDQGDKYIADTGGKENRIVLSRDVGLLKRSSVNFGYFVREKNSFKQFREIIERYLLKKYIKPFSICIKCNGNIISIRKERIIHLLEKGTKNEYEEFWQCKKCQQIYWKGSHYQKMKLLIENIKQA